jgi:hypothetical protein
VHSTDGNLTYDSRLGVLVIRIEGGSDTTLVAASGIGVLVEANHMAVGWHSIELASIANGCKIVAWIRQPSEVTALARLAERSGELCIVAFSDIDEGGSP